MTLHGRRLDHWTTSLDAIEALRERYERGTEGDAQTRALMAQVLHAKSSSFILLLDDRGHVLDVNPAALIAGGVDRSEVIGLPLWTTAWWTGVGEDTVTWLREAVAAAAS